MNSSALEDNDYYTLIYDCFPQIRHYIQENSYGIRYNHLEG